MFYALPRQMFGLVQSKLFPKYFLTGMGMTSITLATYMARNPFRMWSGDSKIQVNDFKRIQNNPFIF